MQHPVSESRKLTLVNLPAHRNQEKTWAAPRSDIQSALVSVAPSQSPTALRTNERHFPKSLVCSNCQGSRFRSAESLPKWGRETAPEMKIEHTTSWRYLRDAHF